MNVGAIIIEKLVRLESLTVGWNPMDIVSGEVAVVVVALFPEVIGVNADPVNAEPVNVSVVLELVAVLSVSWVVALVALVAVVTATTLLTSLAKSGWFS